MNACMASFLCERKTTNVNHEKSSTITYAYYLAYRLMVDVGPNKSICNSLSGLKIESMPLLLKDV